MSTSKTIAKGSAWILIATIIIKLFAWIYYVVLARIVPPEEIGAFFLVLSIIGIIGLFSSLGLGEGAIVRYVPFYAGKEKFNYVRNVLKVSLSAGTIFSLICAFFIVLSADTISNFCGNPDMVPIFYIMTLFLLISNFYCTARGFLQGRKLMKFFSYVESIREVSKVILTIGLLFFVGAKAESIALGYILAFLFAALIGLYWVLKEYNSLPVSDEKVNSFLLLREMIPFGLTLVLISSMSLINEYTGKIMLGYFFPGELGAAMIGIYTIAIVLSTMISVFGSAIGSIFYPLVTELWSRKDITGINKTTITVMRWICITSIPLLIVMLVFPTQILTIFYGQNYASGYMVLMLYSAGIFISIFSTPSQWILAAMKRLDITGKIIAVGATLNIILNFILIPKYGINGAALTSAISFTIMTILFLRQSEITNVQFPKDIHKPIIAGIFASVILYLITTVFNFDEILINFVSLAITQKDIFSEILLKFLKVFVLGIFVLIAFSIYFVFLIKFKAFHKEDVEILAGGMRRAKIPEKWISFAERILLR